MLNIFADHNRNMTACSCTMAPLTTCMSNITFRLPLRHGSTLYQSSIDYPHAKHLMPFLATSRPILRYAPAHWSYFSLWVRFTTETVYAFVCVYVRCSVECGITTISLRPIFSPLKIFPCCFTETIKFIYKLVPFLITTARLVIFRYFPINPSANNSYRRS